MQRLRSVLAQVALEMIAPEKTMLLNLRTETIVYISSKRMVNMSNTFRNCLKGGGGGLTRGRGFIKSLGSQTGGG